MRDDRDYSAAAHSSLAVWLSDKSETKQDGNKVVLVILVLESIELGRPWRWRWPLHCACQVSERAGKLASNVRPFCCKLQLLSLKKSFVVSRLLLADNNPAENDGATNSRAAPSVLSNNYRRRFQRECL